jgi:hypothetical protein
LELEPKADSARPTRSSSNTDFYARAHEPKQLWEVPGSGHVGGVDAQPGGYEKRIVAVFDRRLLDAR